VTPTARSALRGIVRLGALLSICLGTLSLAPVQPALGDNTSSWSFNWLGQDPAAPTPWRPTNWSVVVHSRDVNTLETLDAMDAQHGADCSPPPATHPISSYQDAVFVCKQHMMTAINAQGYGAIYLTPDHMMDFSGGATSSLKFSVSTTRTSLRDWWDVWITPWQENLVLPLDMNMPDLSGPPRDSLHLMLMDDDRFTAELVRNCVPNACTDSDLPVASTDSWDSRVPPSERIRTPFELDLSQNHVRFGIPSANLFWIDTDVPGGLPFTSGIVQIGHHSYTPLKDAGCGPPPGQATCEPNTWHWSDFAITRTSSFGILNADQMAAHQGTDTVHFPAAAPAGSFLRFAGLGTLQVSFNGGAPVKPQLAVQGGNKGQGITDPSQYASYWTPVPAGTTSARFSGQDWWGGPWWAQGIAIWSGTPVAVTGQGPAPGGTTSAGSGTRPPAAPALNEHIGLPAAATTRTAALPRAGGFGALVARVPNAPVTLPVAGALLLLIALGATGLGVYRVGYRRGVKGPAAAHAAPSHSIPPPPEGESRGDRGLG
jgi:hypothetical protein